MGPGGQTCHNADEHQRTIIRKIEKVQSPKMGFPEITPERLGGPRVPKGYHGGPRGALKLLKYMHPQRLLSSFKKNTVFK